MAKKSYPPADQSAGGGAELPDDVIPLTAAGFDQVFSNIMAIINLVPAKKQVTAAEYLSPVHNFLERVRNELFPGVDYEAPSDRQREAPQ